MPNPSFIVSVTNPGPLSPMLNCDPTKPCSTHSACLLQCFFTFPKYFVVYLCPKRDNSSQ